ncbi:hypothetical protein CK203_115776 [Vitis vinifera]|uniref:Uncharacterized protein n=1 Tax=Vitis vinifera TaxID=29760 RepID=A0A438EZI1_VITVI|nr:hypothetical protein CK203_115776 [Vitis vinifera]
MDTFRYEGNSSLYFSDSLTSFQLPDPSGRRLDVSPDRQEVIRNEIDKLLEAGFIREVFLSGLVGKRSGSTKKEGKWRVCVDYTNLNNACPKDSFPLPNRSNCGLHFRARDALFLGCLLRISPDSHVPG